MDPWSRSSGQASPARRDRAQGWGVEATPPPTGGTSGANGIRTVPSTGGARPGPLGSRQRKRPKIEICNRSGRQSTASFGGVRSLRGVVGPYGRIQEWGACLPAPEYSRAILRILAARRGARRARAPGAQGGPGQTRQPLIRALHPGPGRLGPRHRRPGGRRAAANLGTVHVRQREHRAGCLPLLRLGVPDPRSLAPVGGPGHRLGARRAAGPDLPDDASRHPGRQPARNPLPPDLRPALPRVRGLLPGSLGRRPGRVPREVARGPGPPARPALLSRHRPRDRDGRRRHDEPARPAPHRALELQRARPLLPAPARPSGRPRDHPPPPARPPDGHPPECGLRRSDRARVGRGVGSPPADALHPHRPGRPAGRGLHPARGDSPLSVGAGGAAPGPVGRRLPPPGPAGPRPRPAGSGAGPLPFPHDPRRHGRAPADPRVDAGTGDGDDSDRGPRRRGRADHAREPARRRTEPRGRGDAGVGDAGPGAGRAAARRGARP